MMEFSYIYMVLNCAFVLGNVWNVLVRGLIGVGHLWYKWSLLFSLCVNE